MSESLLMAMLMFSLMTKRKVPSTVLLSRTVVLIQPGDEVGAHVLTYDKILKSSFNRNSKATVKGALSGLRLVLATESPLK